MNISRLTALILGLVLSAAVPVLAQTFGVEKRISPHPLGGAISNNPSVHASGNSVYLVWSHQEGGAASEVYFARSTDNGASFSTPVNISNRAGTDIEPVVVGDGTNVHIFWMDEVAGEPAGSGVNTGAGRIFYARSTNNGANFTAPTAIVDQIGYSRVTSAIVNGAQVHLVFYDNRVTGGSPSSVGKVFHKLSCDSGASWAAETNVTEYDGDVDSEQPRIAQLSTGEIYIAFRSSRIGVPQGGWPPFHAFILRMNSAACPGGATWMYPAQRISSGSETNLGGNYGVNIFPGASGRLHALWWNDTAGTNLQYRQGMPNGAGLGPTTDISEFGLNHLQWEHMTERLGFGLGEDAAGRVHAIFQQNSVLRGGFQAGALWYRCAPSAGAAFVAKQLLTGSTVSEPRAVYSNNRLHVIWQDYRHSASPSNQSEIYYNYVDTTACNAPPPTSAPTPSVATLDFGGNSMQTTSGGTVLTLTNNGGGNLIITDFSATSGFAVAGHTCGTVAPGGNCTVTLTFTPATEGTVNGTLTITYSGGTANVNLTGVGERSMVTHYYRAILNRAPDGAGKSFWESEATRLTSLGVNINETWFVMAGYFFNSAEYTAANKNNTQFVTDLYNTFFNRGPDQGGLDYWVGQINAGLPREVVLFSFMFSNEFRTFTQGIFGNTAARPEVDMVVDFFRGLLNRLPDTPSFNYWLGELRTAQCQGAGQVYAKVDQISAAFMFNPEYDGRGRSNSQFVTDMYYSFLRRGGDIGGVNYWINELNTGARFRNDVRYYGFLNSAEFGTRVQAVINAGCAN